MKRFKNILLLYECGSATIDRAATLAKNKRARLTVVRIFRNVPEQWRQMSLGGEPIDLQELAIKEYQSRPKQFVLPLKQHGVRASTKVLVGIPFLENLREGEKTFRRVARNHAADARAGNRAHREKFNMVGFNVTEYRGRAAARRRVAAQAQIDAELAGYTFTHLPQITITDAEPAQTLKKVQDPTGNQKDKHQVAKKRFHWACMLEWRD